MANVHVIIGEDDYLVSEMAKKTIGDGVGLETIDSLNSTAADRQLEDLRRADESLATPPFLDPRKVTWWRNVHFLPGAGKKSAAEDVRKALDGFAKRLAAADLPENQHFILSGPCLLATSTFAKTLAGSAEIVVFKEAKPSQQARQAAARAMDFAGGLGLKFAPGVADMFVARAGCDSRTLLSELEKLREYIGPGRDMVGAADVADITSLSAGSEPAGWNLTDPVGDRDARAAMAALERFKTGDGFAVYVPAMLERFFRQLAELKDAQERGFFDQATEGMNPYVANKLRRFAGKWTLRELRVARHRFFRLRERAVSGSGESAAVLVDAEILRAIGRARR